MPTERDDSTSEIFAAFFSKKTNFDASNSANQQRLKWRRAIKLFVSKKMTQIVNKGEQKTDLTEHKFSTFLFVYNYLDKVR